MITIEVNGEEKKLEFFTSIKELPIKRFNLLQKYTLIDASVGSTIADIERHFTRLDQFIEAKDWESVEIERENMFMNYQFMLGQNYVKGYVFASMIKKIDGQVIDVDDSNIDELVNMLECSSIITGDLEHLVDTQKKSLMRSYQ